MDLDIWMLFCSSVIFIFIFLWLFVYVSFRYRWDRTCRLDLYLDWRELKKHGWIRSSCGWSMAQVRSNGLHAPGLQTMCYRLFTHDQSMHADIARERVYLLTLVYIPRRCCPRCALCGWPLAHPSLSKPTSLCSHLRKSSWHSSRPLAQMPVMQMGNFFVWVHALYDRNFCICTLLTSAPTPIYTAIRVQANQAPLSQTLTQAASNLSRSFSTFRVSLRVLACFMHTCLQVSMRRSSNYTWDVCTVYVCSHISYSYNRSCCREGTLEWGFARTHLTRTHTRACAHPPHTHIHAHAHTNTSTYTHPTHTQHTPNTHTHTLTHSHTHTHTLTHTHTHTITHTHAHTVTAQALPPQQGAEEEMGEGSARILEALFSVDPTYVFPSKLLSGGHDDDKKDDRYVNINDGCVNICTYVL